MLTFLLKLFRAYRSTDLRNKIRIVRAQVEDAKRTAEDSEKALTSALTHISIELGQVSKMKGDLTAMIPKDPA